MGRKKERSKFPDFTPKAAFSSCCDSLSWFREGKKGEGDGIDLPLARIKYGVESLLDLFRLQSKARGIDMKYICVFQTTAFDYLDHWSIMFSVVKEVFRILENAVVYF